MSGATQEELFLSKEAVRRLTGCAHKATQIDRLKDQRIPFFIDRMGWPVVTRAAVEGARSVPAAEAKKGWVPRVLRSA